MRLMFIGANKSGKSKLAEAYTLNMAKGKPYYIATGIVTDKEMEEKIKIHKLNRKDKFITIEEPLNLHEAIRFIEEYKVIDCLSFWVNNMLFYNKEQSILEEAKEIASIDNLIVVINEVGAGVIPENALGRKFSHYNGLVSQIFAEASDEVYLCIAGLKVKIK